ncbi:hypothetical protein, partial [Nioella nitratireducens]|uniref:hypothetical protein n=1 Tax=Nioella nitratireducens TaxID=1287720 RepID=UPI001F27F91D
SPQTKEASESQITRQLESVGAANRLQPITTMRQHFDPVANAGGAGRQIRTSLTKGSVAVPHAAQRPRHSPRAAARLAFK